MKRIVSILLASVLLIGIMIVIPVGTASATTYVITASDRTYYINGRTVRHRFPKINLSGSGAASINNDIQERINSQIQGTQNVINAGYPEYVTSDISYQWYLNDSILSVIIIYGPPINYLSYPESHRAYAVYNINVATGKRLYNSDILSIKNASQSKAQNNVCAVIRKTYAKNSHNIYEQDCEEKLNENFNYWMSHIEYYLGKNGKLMAKIHMPWPAGQGDAVIVSELNAYTDTPRITKFTNVNSGINMAWSISPGAAKYRVFAKTSSGWKKAADVTANSYTYKTTASGKKYTFTVRALDRYGNYISAYNSTGWSYTFLSAPKITSLTNTSGGIVARWNTVPGAKYYRLFIKTTGGWTKVCDTKSTRWTSTKVKNGVRYTFTVRCVNAAGTAYISGYNAAGTSIICRR